MRHRRRPRLARLIALGAMVMALMGATSISTHPSPGELVSNEELESLLAPIALYPDGLLTQVLMASTYPLEVVEADRFVKRNSELRGDALGKAVAKKQWDHSVQSLAAYAKVLAMMSDKLEWTERLGDAVLEDQARVMDTVQALRRQAESTGNLQSSEKQTVVHEKETIVIEPAQKEVVYVVEYDPAVVYGAAWYAASRYYYYERYYGRYSYSLSGSYSSYHVSASNYGWARANWHERSVSVDGRGNGFASGSARAQGASAWQHDPSHRGNVAYPTDAVRERFPAGKASPSGLQPLGAAGPAPGGLDAGPGQLPFGDRAMPGPPSIPAGGLSRLGSGGPPNVGGGGPPGFGGGGLPGFGAGLPGPPPGPPGPH